MIPHKNKKVYIIEPLEHGNGGCYGSKVLSNLPLRNALKTDPMSMFDIYDYGITFYPRICTTENMNDCVYVWDNEYRNWVKF